MQVDKDRDGLVERNELPLLVKKTKINQINEGVNYMLNIVKDNGTGKLKISDFLTMVVYYANTEEKFRDENMLLEKNKVFGCWSSKGKKYEEYF